MDRPGVPEDKRVYWLIKALLSEYSWEEIRVALLAALDKAIEYKATTFKLNGVPDNALLFPDDQEEYRMIKQLVGGQRNAKGESGQEGDGEEVETEAEAEAEAEAETRPQAQAEDEKGVGSAYAASRAPSGTAGIDLSILIPARNEMFLARTIQDILENREAEIEIIATLDGEWIDPPVPQHERINIIYVPEPVGQRAATNLAARLARGRYIMKLDAHCSFDKGFDKKVLEAFDKLPDDIGDVTIVPVMRNLHAFDWKCFHCGWKTYQGRMPEKCGDPKCGKSDRLKRKMIWKGKSNPQSWSYCFDAQPHFQYFNDYKDRPGVRERAGITGLTESMSLQGSCFVAPKEMYWRLKLCDETFGSWGNQGIEVALKTWLTGGTVYVSHRTWYAHLFRTQGGDFGFPYENRGSHETKRKVWDFFINGKLENQLHPISWLVEKFWPVPGWTDDDLVNLKKREAGIGKTG